MPEIPDSPYSDKSKSYLPFNLTNRAEIKMDLVNGEVVAFGGIGENKIINTWTRDPKHNLLYITEGTTKEAAQKSAQMLYDSFQNPLPTLASTYNEFDSNRRKTTHGNDTVGLTGVYFTNNGPAGAPGHVFEINRLPQDYRQRRRGYNASNNEIRTIAVEEHAPGLILSQSLQATLGREEIHRMHDAIYRGFREQPNEQNRMGIVKRVVLNFISQYQLTHGAFENDATIIFWEYTAGVVPPPPAPELPEIREKLSFDERASTMEINRPQDPIRVTGIHVQGTEVDRVINYAHANAEMGIVTIGEGKDRTTLNRQSTQFDQALQQQRKPLNYDRVGRAYTSVFANTQDTAMLGGVFLSPHKGRAQMIEINKPEGKSGSINDLVPTNIQKKDIQILISRTLAEYLGDYMVEQMNNQIFDALEANTQKEVQEQESREAILKRIVKEYLTRLRQIEPSDDTAIMLIEYQKGKEKLQARKEPETVVESQLPMRQTKRKQRNFYTHTIRPLINHLLEQDINIGRQVFTILPLIAFGGMLLPETLWAAPVLAYLGGKALWELGIKNLVDAKNPWELFKQTFSRVKKKT